MNDKQFQQVYTLANSQRELKEDLSIFQGCYFQDKLINCTIEAVACFLRYQAKNLDGTWHSEELDNCKKLMRRKFNIIGPVTINLDSLLLFNVVEGHLMQRENGKVVYLQDVIELLNSQGYKVIYEISN